MTLFKDKYRIESVCLPGYDYSQPGAYFITIVTHNRQCLFGNIVDGEMIRNEFGELVKTEWSKTALIRPNIVIDAFVVMPNHLHGILICYLAYKKSSVHLRALCSKEKYISPLRTSEIPLNDFLDLSLIFSPHQFLQNQRTLRRFCRRFFSSFLRNAKKHYCLP